MKTIHLDHSISDKERAKHCFAGDLIIFENIPAMHEMIDYADKILSKALGGIEPIEAQHKYQPEEFLLRTGKAQAFFRNSNDAKAIFFKALTQCGVDLESTFYDYFPMRIVPFDNDYNGAECGILEHHRDSWGSNIQSQINWWAPIYELSEDRTIGVYPEYWDKPIANDTGSWSHKEYLKKREQVAAERKGAYPSAPKPISKVDESGIVKVMLKPGDILCFSSAQLHASVPNTTEVTRFSVEMRTINKHDVEAKREAPNVDNEGEKPMYQWFKNIKTKANLAHL